MSQYIENNLGKDEVIILKAKKNPLYILMPIIGMIIDSVPAIFLSVMLSKGEIKIGTGGAFSVFGIFAGVFVLLLWKICQFLSINLAVTNKRVVGKIGILSVKSIDIHIDKIDHVQIEAGILGNLFKYYSLQIFSVGGAGYDSRRRKGQFVGIKNAQEFKDVVTEAIEQHAVEARKAQADEIARAMGNQQAEVARAINEDNN